jgi:hypothetical protein
LAEKKREKGQGEVKYLNDIIRNNYRISFDSINANLKEYSTITDEITKRRPIG